MWTATVFLLLILGGCSIANEDCNINPALSCINEDFTLAFPENEDEALSICNVFKSSTECFLNFTVSCEGNENEIREMRKVISYLDENCQPDSPIFQGAINSLECIKPVFSKENEECKKPDDSKTMKFFMYLMDLSERGIKDASDSDSNMRKCLDVLYIDACSAAEVGLKCGAEARNSVVDILQNLDKHLTICKQDIIDDMITLVEMFESTEN